MTPQTLKSYNELLVALFLIYLFYLMSWCAGRKINWKSMLNTNTKIKTHHNVMYLSLAATRCRRQSAVSVVVAMQAREFMTGQSFFTYHPAEYKNWLLD